MISQLVWITALRELLTAARAGAFPAALALASLRSCARALVRSYARHVAVLHAACTLHALAAVASLLADRMEALPALDGQHAFRNGLASLFRRVAGRSRPLYPVADPPPSAWPASLISTYSTCLRAISSVMNAQQGTASAPLSEVWELYQAWVADQLVRGLTVVLGRRQACAGQADPLGIWSDGDGTIELRYQAVIPSLRGQALEVLGERFVAVVGSLQPDLLVVRRGTDTRSVVVDAKKRSSYMKLDDLTENVSKYQWGVRRESSQALVPLLEATLLVAPLGGPTASSPDGRGRVVSSHPSAPALDLAARVIALLRDGPRLRVELNWATAKTVDLPAVVTACEAGLADQGGLGSANSTA